MKYRLTEKIGTGGMAEVFRAVGEGPEGFERAFVIKRIHPRLSEAPEFVRMFVDEAKISARLIHPNIVQVFEFAYQAGGYYIVMEPVDGIDMGRLLRRLEQRREVPPPAFVAEVGRQACRGLDFAHTLTSSDGKQLGIVHRDVTPPNIMVAWNGTVKIVDFGIARAVQEIRTNMTEAGMVKGKMSYVAPELLQGETADARADVFSLGVVLHGLLSGKQLFQGDNDLETLKMVQEMVIPPPSARNPGVKRALDAIVMRALERNPAKRYQSAGEMGDDLETLVLRERYSTRALGRKARELVPPETETAAIPEASGSEIGLQMEGGSPTSLGQRDAVIVMDDVASRSAVPGALPATGSQPHESSVRTSSRMRAYRTGSGMSSGVHPAATTNGGQVPGQVPQLPIDRIDRWRWAWVAIGLPLILTAVLLGVVRWPGASRPLNASATPAETAPSPLVRVSLDSSPQGATVIGPASGAGGGKRHVLGETPLLLTLARGAAPLEFVLSKPGFVPLPFRIIPHLDKDVVATLERVAPPVAAAELPLVKPPRHGSHHTSSSTSTTTLSKAPRVAASAAHPPAPATSTLSIRR
jgi:serine/threonine protein kinase